MHLLVIGASRGIGAATVAEALRRGHRVRAFARSAGDMAPREGLEPFTGDATDATDLDRALQGVDAVILALGIRESVAMLWQEVTLFSRATRTLIPLMEAHGPDRLIAVTGIGAGDSRRALSLPERIGHRVVFSKPYADKTRQEELIMQSRLRWTIARPTILTRGAASRRYQVLTDPAQWRMGLISRADVADFLVRAAEDDSTVGTAPVLAR